MTAMIQVTGKRLTYSELTRKEAGASNYALAPESREAEALDFLRSFALFSASSFALISECGTAIRRRITSVNSAKSPVMFFASASSSSVIESFELFLRSDSMCSKILRSMYGRTPSSHQPASAAASKRLLWRVFF